MRWTKKDYEEHQLKMLKQRQKRLVEEKKEKSNRGKKIALKIQEEINEKKKEIEELEPEKENKYGNIRTEVDGINFHSIKEADYYHKLKLLEKAGEVVDIELQPKFLLQEGFNKNGKRHRPINYYADFRVKYKDGRDEIVDVKSSKTFKTQLYNIKKKLFEYKYPELEIKEIYDVDLF